MKLICDFHLHSKYSRATSRNMDLPNIEKWARLKGINVVGTGDFTHPDWFRQIREQLEPAEEGLFRLKERFRLNGSSGAAEFSPRFILTTEISCIYSKEGKTRKLHNLVFLPDLASVEKFSVQLGWIGNLRSDGRPILGLDAQELLKMALETSPVAFFVPAHIWTPWFSLFGSCSGFNKLQEAFGDLSEHIYSLETGLSSDPAMNWRLSGLDHLTLMSNSDAHSPAKLGREANVLESDLSYNGIIQSVKNADPEKYFTIEFFPEEGKYHYDGHRNCSVRFSPEQSKEYQGICPNCGRPLTLGVMYRVNELADRPLGYRPNGKPDYKNLIPLEEIIAESLEQKVGTKAVSKEYQKLISNFKTEFNILLNVCLKEIERITGSDIAEAIRRVREGRLKIEPGYDGVFGKIAIFDEKERENTSSQKTLF